MIRHTVATSHHISEFESNHSNLNLDQFAYLNHTTECFPTDFFHFQIKSFQLNYEYFNDKARTKMHFLYLKGKNPNIKELYA